MFDIFYIGNKPNLFAHEKSVDSVEQARELSRTRFCWVVNYLSDYRDFDFLWEPAPWQHNQKHVWPSQHQDNGGTWLIPKQPTDDINREHCPVDRIQSVPRLHIKHTAHSEDAGDVNARYISDYLGTMRRALKNTNWQWCWVTSDVCDYSGFDFTWHPSEWQDQMLHVFASNDQKFGDTFYVHVPSFLQKTQNLKILEWFETLHFVDNVSVPRQPITQVKYTTDSVVPAIWQHEFDTPLVEFVRHDHNTTSTPTVSLWQEKTKTVCVLNRDHSHVVVPRECKNYLTTQVYDYPYIDKNNITVQGQPQDIVYISYDEPEAETNWGQLHSRFPQAQRIHGVAGMENALKAAATASRTAWYFAVFAKTKLDSGFKFDFVPDYLQQAKHYIFDCKNSVNGLQYGHMGVVMYNCNLVITAREYNELGLDYTMSFPHEVVPMLSCHGEFNTTPYHTWRTAFREVSKLCYINQQQPDVETQHRLKTWITQAQGAHSDWCLAGARDGQEFYQETQGNLVELKKSFRWEWLRQRFVSRYGELD